MRLRHLSSEGQQESGTWRMVLMMAGRPRSYWLAQRPKSSGLPWTQTVGVPDPAGPGVAKAVIDQSLPAASCPWFRVTNSGIAAVRACVMVAPSRPTISSERRMRPRCCSRRKTFPPKVRSFSVTVVPSKKPRSSTSIPSWARGIQLPFR